MSHARYLTILAQALRYEVAPAVSEAGASDALNVVLRTLTAIAVTMEDAELADGTGLPANIPAELKVAFADLAPAPADTVLLPHRSPGGDLPGGARHGRELALAAHYVADDKASRAELVRMVAWESAQRRALIARIDTLLTSGSDDVDKPPFTGIPIDRLEAFLRQRFDAPDLRIVEFKVVPGGRSRQTALVSIEGCGALPADMVCQRDHPAGVNIDASVARQHRVLSVLHEAALRVPRPVLFEEDPTWLGAPFLLTERLNGLPGVNAGTDYFRQLGRDDRLAESLACQMGQLHAIDPGRFEGIFNVTGNSGLDLWTRDIDAIRDRWRNNAPAPSVTIEATLNWLYQNVDCIQDLSTTVHTDMLLHNTLVENGEISGVLDWEAVQHGHPGQDLGYVFPVMCQLTDWPRFMAAYCAAGGYDLDLRQVRWFSLRAMLLFSSYVQNVGRLVETSATNDVRMAESAVAWGGRFIDRLADVLEGVLAEEAVSVPRMPELAAN